MLFRSTEVSPIKPPDVKQESNKHELTLMLNDLLKKQLHKVLAASIYNQEVEKIEKNIDRILITGYNFVHDENCLITSFVRKLGFNLRDKDLTWYSYYQPHHISHAFNAFYNSKFEEALVIVSDGRGSTINLTDGSQAFETTSVFKINNRIDIELLYKRLYANNFDSPVHRDTFTVNNKLLGQTNRTKLDEIGRAHV